MQIAIAHKIKKATWRSDNNINRPCVECARLLLIIFATDQCDRMQTAVFIEEVGVACNLNCQLTSWSNDERAGLREIALLLNGIAQQVIDNSNQECRCLTGAGLRLARHIVTLQCMHEALRLNRRTEFEAKRVDCLAQRLLQIKCIE